jgi:hypothetical protein
MNTVTSVPEPTLELAGYFAAHALWCVSDGSTLVPMMAVQRETGGGELHRLVDDDQQRAIAMGRERLVANPDGASRSVLIYDVSVTLPSGRTDALMLDVVDYDPPRSATRMVIPYRAAGAGQRFAVHPVLVIGGDGTLSSSGPELAAFHRGLGRHEEGARVWRDHFRPDR